MFLRRPNNCLPILFNFRSFHQICVAPDVSHRVSVFPLFFLSIPTAACCPNRVSAFSNVFLSHSRLCGLFFSMFFSRVLFFILSGLFVHFYLCVSAKSFCFVATGLCEYPGLQPCIGGGANPKNSHWRQQVHLHLYQSRCVWKTQVRVVYVIACAMYAHHTSGYGT